MAEVVQLRPKRPCPICGKASTQKFHPFCSSRCAQVDLHRWLGGAYAIPVAETEDEDGGTPEET
ncbi:DNA gyrase inhibitor YacG [Aestuariivirga sp.]|uniref:DNA gyrase inhibitor YacG n=1 Tax=Aestuariivirga sp. TaxID=2650926 RepID=UPI0039E42544